MKVGAHGWSEPEADAKVANNKALSGVTSNIVVNGERRMDVDAQIEVVYERMKGKGF